MRITTLDGYTLNPGNLSGEWLAALDDLTVHCRMPQKLIAERAGGGGHGANERGAARLYGESEGITR